MKKITTVFVAMFLVLNVFAKLEESQIIGKWKYSVSTDGGVMNGVFNFTEKDGKLAGQVETDDGYIIPFSKIELKEENTLYLELQTDSDLIKISVKVEGNTFKGTGTSYQGEAPITGEKQ